MCPGRFGTEISASLFVVDVVHLSGAVLHEAQKWIRFVALSYNWRPAVFPRSINVKYIECPITENLYAFLQRYRREWRSSYISVDAVCIKQLGLVSQLSLYSPLSKSCAWEMRTITSKDRLPARTLDGLRALNMNIHTIIPRP